MGLNRAERRRLGIKEKVRTYNFTEEQITRVVNNEIEKRIDAIKVEATDEIVRTTTTLSFGLILKVMMDKYWKKTYKRRSPDLINDLLDEFGKWEKGEITKEDLEEILWEVGGIKVK